ncbi:MAG: type II toxin-antitoxin system RelB/DinJ family antitoxin [bacterium]
MTTIQIRIDEKTKKQSQKVFEALGLDMSSGVKLYLQRVIKQKGIPFRVVTENGLTIEQEERILKASEEAKRGINVTKSMTVKEALEYLKSK